MTYVDKEENQGQKNTCDFKIGLYQRTHFYSSEIYFGELIYTSKPLAVFQQSWVESIFID